MLLSLKISEFDIKTIFLFLIVAIPRPFMAIYNLLFKNLDTPNFFLLTLSIVVIFLFL